MNESIAAVTGSMATIVVACFVTGLSAYLVLGNAAAKFFEITQWGLGFLMLRIVVLLVFGTPSERMRLLSALLAWLRNDFFYFAAPAVAFGIIALVIWNTRHQAKAINGAADAR